MLEKNRWFANPDLREGHGCQPTKMGAAGYPDFVQDVRTFPLSDNVNRARCSKPPTIADSDATYSDDDPRRRLDRN